MVAGRPCGGPFTPRPEYPGREARKSQLRALMASHTLRGARLSAAVSACTQAVGQSRTRRDFTLRLLQTGAIFALPRGASAQTTRREFEDHFDSLLGELARTPSLSSGIRRDEDDRIAEGAALAQEQTFIRAFPSTRKISKRATSLIISAEVSGVSQYTERFHRPTWPGGSSGVTIGIGYDLGFVRVADFHGDWSAYLPAEDFRILSACCQLQGARARAAVNSVARVDIPWPVASRQYEEQIQPRRIGETETVLRNCDLLSADSLGALVSLVYNRGAAGFLVPQTKDPSGRFTEMRNIRTLMETRKFAGIPAQLLAMRRLWQKSRGGQGLVLRRELEAQLFSLGLST
jgi:GH24 family phage-related lysozyme (muramidase)